ncbi:MAG: tRNA lysidine(34) synthetase TilS, partial [Muribaculaceae bacterium]|nr:tRNA lysidine(34) synthetase TilS [Muribaculaceae bacterium]
DNKLLDPGDRVIVALSGGADSVALLAALVALGYDCLAAHCNFHLRGVESQRDMLHAQEVCKRLGVDFMVHDFDVAARQRETGESVEMACRALRYEWFDRLLTQERARAIAVGHHCEDNIETILLNLFRSTGIDGMRGIKYRRGYVIRPMLDCTRQQIEQYLAASGLTFIVDSSNSSDAHLRNRLRNHVIPELLRHFPNADRAILASASNLEAAARIYHRAIDGYRDKYISGDDKIDLLGLLSEAADDAPTVLRELLKDIGITSTQCADIIASSNRSGLKFLAHSGTTVELDRGVLTIFRPKGLTGPTRPSDPIPVDLRRDVLTPVNLRISRQHITEFAPQRDPNVLYLDSASLSPGHKWALRRWRESDRIRPFGLKGTRLVSDLFSDAKYSAADKRKAWLLTCDDKIVWVLGLRPS